MAMRHHPQITFTISVPTTGATRPIGGRPIARRGSFLGLITVSCAVGLNGWAAVVKGVTVVLFTIPAHFGYGVLAALVTGESAGLPIPGETALVAAALLARHGNLSIPIVVAVAAGAAIVGDNLGYWFGRRAGRRALQAERGPFRHHRWRLLGRGEVFFARYGAKAVFIARWVAGVRTVAAVVAGATGMPVGRFMIANALGALAWAASTGTLVFMFGGVGAAIALASGTAFAGAGAVVAAIGAWRSRPHNLAVPASAQEAAR